jgi:site-specific recombinase
MIEPVFTMMKEQSMRTSFQSSVTDRLEEAGRRAGEMAHQQSQHYYDEGRELASTLAHQLEDYVRQQPIRSILITVGLVCLTTAMFIRR